MKLFELSLSAMAIMFVASSKIRKDVNNNEDVQNIKEQSAIINDNELRKLRIDLFKKDVMKKLNMDKPPNLSQDVQSSLRRVFDGHPKFWEKAEGTEATILFPESVLYEKSRIYPTISLAFRFKPEILPKHVLSAELWFYKKRPSNGKHHKFTIAEVPNDENLQIPTLNSSKVINESKWSFIDTSHMVRKWYGQQSTARTMELYCNDCDQDFRIPITEMHNMKPYIKITLVEESRKRNKRDASTCNNETGFSNCCKEDLYISFEEIGWDNWIMYPSGYKANYCKGVCNTPLDMLRNIHASVLWQFIGKKPLKAKELNVNIYCSPSKMSSQSMIYVTDDKVVHEEVMEDATVEECSCK